MFFMKIYLNVLITPQVCTIANINIEKKIKNWIDNYNYTRVVHKILY